MPSGGSLSGGLTYGVSRKLADAARSARSLPRTPGGGRRPASGSVRRSVRRAPKGRAPKDRLGRSPAHRARGRLEAEASSPAEREAGGGGRPRAAIGAGAAGRAHPLTRKRRVGAGASRRTPHAQVRLWARAGRRTCFAACRYTRGMGFYLSKAGTHGYRRGTQAASRGMSLTSGLTSGRIV